MDRLPSLLLASAMLAGCATTEATQISPNQLLVSTAAAPACGVEGAARVARRTAAVETIRRGYDRFTVLDASSADNTNTATVSMPVGGIYVPVPMDMGTNDAELQIVMLRPGDSEYGSAIDARAELGPNWETFVRRGLRTCREGRARS